MATRTIYVVSDLRMEKPREASVAVVSAFTSSDKAKQDAIERMARFMPNRVFIVHEVELQEG